MGMYIAIVPDADRGMPRWGVPPIHVQGARIGIGAPLAVAQPQALQRHAESAACPSQARFCVRPPPKCHGHSWIGIGSVENRLRIMAFRSNIDKLRDGCWTHRGRRGFRHDSTAASLASGGDGFSPRAFRCADRAVHQSRRNRTMARTKRSRRSYGAGEWGRNRVRVFPDPKTGLYQVEWRENGRRLTRSLGHREWIRAKRQALSESHLTVTVELTGFGGVVPAV